MRSMRMKRIGLWMDSDVWDDSQDSIDDSAWLDSDVWDEEADWSDI